MTDRFYRIINCT